jgi:UDP-glucose 4-epimerase
MKVLVTGGAGFIGSYLIDHLIKFGYNCIVLDNLFQNSISNIQHNLQRVKFYKVDITNKDELVRVFNEEKPENVFHLAAHHFIPFCNEKPVEAITTNIIGTQNIADMCIQYSVKKIYFASTAAVYAPSESMHKESDNPDPIDIYGVSKLSGEKIMRFLHEKTGMQVMIGRFFNAIGKRETNPHIIPEILKQLSQNPEQPTLKLGNLHPLRDYIHASDMARAAISLIESSEKFDIVNIGLGKAYSVKDLISLFESAIGKKIEVFEDPARVRKSDRPVLCADNTKLKNKYHWEPAFSLQDTINSLFD